jgi:HD-like signal output (HDOD) protein
MDPTLEKQILACRSLPSLPLAALDLLAESRRPNVDLQRVAEIISGDPALAARVVRAANAAAFGWGEVASVPRAVFLLGATRVLVVALTFSLVAIRREGERDGFEHGAYWRRAIDSAIAARVVAERSGLDADAAFLAGLVQDIGALALAEALGPRYGSIWKAARGNHFRLADLETERLGSTHAEVTGLLTARWRFPAALHDAALASHEPPPPAGGKIGLRQCVYLSGLLADIWTKDARGDAVLVAYDAARAHAGLDLDGFAALLARVSTLIPEVASELQVTLASEEERKQVLAEAHASMAAMRRKAREGEA